MIAVELKSILHTQKRRTIVIFSSSNADIWLVRKETNEIHRTKNK
jgi:hypothetical protein